MSQVFSVYFVPSACIPLRLLIHPRHQLLIKGQTLSHARGSPINSCSAQVYIFPTAVDHDPFVLKWGKLGSKSQESGIQFAPQIHDFTAHGLGAGYPCHSDGVSQKDVLAP